MANNCFSAYARILLGSTLMVIGCEVFAAEFSAIRGYWVSVKETCPGESDFWEINKSGASGIEELCTVMSATRKGNRYILKQNCAVEGMEMIRTDTFRLLSPGQLEKGGRKYRRCPTPG